MTWEGETGGGKVTCDPTSLVYNSLSGHMVQGQLESQCSLCYCHKKLKMRSQLLCAVYCMVF
jgi:hypothetical protein